MKALGVDIGSSSIKIVELDASPKGYVVNGFVELPLSIDGNRDRALQIIEHLRTLAEQVDSSTVWVVSVPQHQLSLRYKRFPFRERAKITKSLAFELEEEIPFDVEETIFDFKIVEYLGTNANVFAVAAPKEAVGNALAMAKDGGFAPTIVSVDTLAMANLFEVWNAPPHEGNPSLKDPEIPFDETDKLQGLPPPARGRAYLHMGHSRVLLLVYRENTLIGARSILWGGADIQASMVRTLKIPLHEASKVLNERSFILVNSAGASKEQIAMSEAVSSQVDHLIQELRLTLLDLTSSFHFEIDQMELTGGLSQIQNLGAYMTQGLEIPVNVMLGMMQGRAARIEITPQLEAIAPVALGLAIEGIKRQRNPPINLRKGEFAKENRDIKAFWDRWRVPAQIAVSAFILFCIYSITRDQIASSMVDAADAKLIEAATKVAGLKGASANEAGINKYLKKQKDRIGHQDSLNQLDEYVSAVSILAKISDHFPSKLPGGKDVDVTMIEITDDDVTIKGRAHTAAQVSQVQKGLGDLAAAKSLTTVPALDVAGGVPFGFKFKVARKKL